MKIFVKITFFLLVLLPINKYNAQLKYLNNYSLNIEHNLVYPRKLLQDSKGNILIVFNKTIYTFNGYNFRKIYNSNKFIKDIEIKNDSLFLLFPHNKFIYIVDMNNNMSLDSININYDKIKYIIKITYFKNHFYIVGVLKNNKKFHLYRTDVKFKNIKKIISNNYIFKRKYSFQDSTLYLFSHPNIIIAIKDSIKITKIKSKTYSSLFNSKQNYIKDFYIMNNKFFFSILKKGIYIYDLKNNKIILSKSYKHKINIIKGDKNAIVYFLSYNAEHYFYFKNKLFNINEYFYNFPKRPNNLLVDKQNIKWIYDFNKNLYQLNNPLILNMKIIPTKSTSFKYVSYIKTNNKIYIAYNNYFFSIDTNFNYKTIKTFKEPIIKLIKYRSNKLLLINKNKLNNILNFTFFDIIQKKFQSNIKIKMPSHDVKFFSCNNKIFYLYKNILYELKINNNVGISFKLIDKVKKSYNNNNSLIIKTNDNITYLLKDNKFVKLLDIDYDLIHYRNMDSIIFVKNHTIFLKHKDEIKKITTFQKINKYLGLNVVKNKIWFFSPSFIFTYDLKKKFPYYISNDDGLVGVINIENNPVEFNNHLLLINSRVINIIINPDLMYELYKISNNLPTIIEDFTINNIKINKLDSITIYNKRNLSFKCQYNDYIKNKNITISYKITPLMNKWEQSNLNEKIRINNLSYGENILQIKLNFLDQTSKIKKIFIFIQKPFYKTNLFFAIIFLIISSFFAFFSIKDYKYQQEILKTKSETIENLQREVEIKTKELKKYSKKLEQILSETTGNLVIKEMEYENLLNKSQEIIFKVDSNGNIISKNKIANEIFPSIKTVHQVINKKDMIKILKELKQNGNVREYKLTIKNNDKNLYFLLNLFKNSLKNNIYDGLLINITEIINFQEALQRAQKFESIGLLAGGIAHEFNNINTIIKGYTEILLKNKDANSIEYKYLQNIHKASVSLLNITSKILAYARKQYKVSNKIKPYPIIIDVIDFIKSVKKDDIKYIINISENFHEYYIYADPSHIQQIFTNLIINAIDALKDKKDDKKIIFNFDIVEKNEPIKVFDDVIKKGKYIKMSVKDNGHGIKKEHLYKIFELFFTTKPVGSGTGLGLSLVYGLVKQNSGYIDVKSEENKGAEFIIYFKAID